MKVSILAILRHRKLKFGIQIPLDIRKESFWLLGGVGYYGNTKVSSCKPLLNIECSNCLQIIHDISKFGCWVKMVFMATRWRINILVY